jgi:hypothetical protein
MISLRRKILYAITPVILLLSFVEVSLYLIQYEGTSIAELQSTSGFPQNAYVHRRDRILGKWFVKKEGRLLSNPYLLSRGFHQQTFNESPKEKRRYFAMGGSTTYGSPFEHQAKGFPQRLAETLNQQTDDTWEIINVGVAGMDSASFPSVVEEIIEYQPEGILIYAGNNEVRGALIEQCSNPYRIGIEKQLNRSKTIQLLRDQFRRFKKVSVQFDQLAERQDDCMTRVVKEIEKDQTDRQYQYVLRRFEQNLQTSINLALAKNITVYLAIPPINLLQQPSYQHWNHFLEKKKESELQHQLQLTPINWEQILSIDPTYALATYHLGLQLHAVGNKNGLTLLRRAVSQDPLSKRITPEIQKITQNICQTSSEIHCVDVNSAYWQKMNGEIPDQELFEDFCHPTFTVGTDIIVEQFSQAMQ